MVTNWDDFKRWTHEYFVEDVVVLHMGNEVGNKWSASHMGWVALLCVKPWIKAKEHDEEGQGTGGWKDQWCISRVMALKMKAGSTNGMQEESGCWCRNWRCGLCVGWPSGSGPSSLHPLCALLKETSRAAQLPSVTRTRGNWRNSAQWSGKFLCLFRWPLRGKYFGDDGCLSQSLDNIHFLGGITWFHDLRTVSELVNSCFTFF